MARAESDIITDVEINNTSFGVFYYPKAAATFAANRLMRFVGVATTLPLYGGDVFAWYQLNWDSVVSTGTAIYVYVRTADRAEDLDSKEWQGPYLNSGTDISSLDGNFLQIRIGIYAESTSLTSCPTVLMRAMQATCYLAGGNGTFYTKLFNLEFIPTHLVLTHNGRIPTGAVVQFAVAGKETTSNRDYVVIQPNQINALKQLPHITEDFKLRILANGPSADPIAIDEFGFLVSGPGRKNLNQ